MKMAKKTTEQQAPETTAPAQQSESIIWVDPFNPNNIKRFSSNEVKENFIKWQEEHKEYFYNFEIDQIIDLILNPFKNTTPEHQKSYKARLKIFYSKELEKVNDPIKRKTFESVLSIWDDLQLPTHFIVELNKLRQYLKNNEATPIDGEPKNKKELSEIEYIKTHTDIIPDQKKRLLDEMKSEYQFSDYEILKTSIDILVSDYGAKIENDIIILNEFQPYQIITALFEFWKDREYTPDLKRLINKKIKKHFKYINANGIEAFFDNATLTSRRTNIIKYPYFKEFCSKIN